MTNYLPLVSIVIPVYKGATYMRIAIDSALAQTYPNTEVIVVNDGSPDDGETEKIALSYGDKIRYFTKPNGGCASALNFGISQMRGEWFSWLSHDDVYEPDKIKREIDTVKEKQLDTENTILSCEAKIIDENGKEIRHPSAGDTGFYDRDAFVKRLLFGSSLNGCGLLIPKRVLDRVGTFSPDFKYILDRDYWLRAALSGAVLYRMGDEKLVSNRVHRAQVTVREAGRRSSEIAKMCENLFEMSKETNSVRILEDFYLYTGINGQKELQKKYQTLLESQNAFRVKTKLKAGFFQSKQALRTFAAGLYWKAVRNRKSR